MDGIYRQKYINPEKVVQLTISAAFCVQSILSVTSGKPEAPCFLNIAKSFMDGIYRQKYINPEKVVQLNEK